MVKLLELGSKHSYPHVWTLLLKQEYVPAQQKRWQRMFSRHAILTQFWREALHRLEVTTNFNCLFWTDHSVYGWRRKPSGSISQVKASCLYNTRKKIQGIGVSRPCPSWESSSLGGFNSRKLVHSLNPCAHSRASNLLPLRNHPEIGK